MRSLASPAKHKYAASTTLGIITYMSLLWRDPWLKPLSSHDLGAEKCTYCEKRFVQIEFVTSCDFCEIGVMHDQCANKHILSEHKKQLESKINTHRDRPLHEYQ
jgi:hypothetical protein